MKNEKLSITALTISVLPLATLIPALLKIALPVGLRIVWAGANMVFVLAGLILSIICIRKETSRSAINIIAMIVSMLWLLMIVGIAVLALFLNMH